MSRPVGRRQVLVAATSAVLAPLGIAIARAGRVFAPAGATEGLHSAPAARTAPRGSIARIGRAYLQQYPDEANRDTLAARPPPGVGEHRRALVGPAGPDRSGLRVGIGGHPRRLGALSHRGARLGADHPAGRRLTGEPAVVACRQGREPGPGGARPPRARRRSRRRRRRCRRVPSRFRAVTPRRRCSRRRRRRPASSPCPSRSAGAGRCGSPPSPAPCTTPATRRRTRAPRRR